MRTSWEKLVQHVGTTYGQDISNELQNKVTVTLVEPAYTAKVLTRHAIREQTVRGGQLNIQRARRAQPAILLTAVTSGVDIEHT
jgi:hypothetical protein